MRVTAFGLITFFVCLNLSLYLINEFQVLAVEQPEQTPPANIYTQLIGSLLTLGAGALLTYVFENWLFGTGALALWGIQFLLGTDNIVYWIFYGTPEFVNRFASAAQLTTEQILVFQNVTLCLTAIVWFWFILGFISQRQMEI